MDLIVPQGAVVLVVVQVVRFRVRVENPASSLRRQGFDLRVQVPSLQLRRALLSRLTFRVRAQAQVVVAAEAAVASALRALRWIVDHVAVDRSSSRRMDHA